MNKKNPVYEGEDTEATISEGDDLTTEERLKLASSVTEYATRLGQPPTPLPSDFFGGDRFARSAPVATPDDARAFFGDAPTDDDQVERRVTSTGRKMTGEELVALEQAKRLVKEELRAKPVALPPTPVTPPKSSTPLTSVKVDLAPTWSTPADRFIEAATRLESTGDPAFAGLVDAVKSVLREHPELTPADPSANALIGERLHQRRALEELAKSTGVTVEALTPDQFIEAVELEKTRFPLIAVELPDFAKMKGDPTFAEWFAEWKVELGFGFVFTPPAPVSIDIQVDASFFDRWRDSLERTPTADPEDDRQIWTLIRSSATMTAEILIATDFTPALYIDLVKEIIEERKKSNVEKKS